MSDRLDTCGTCRFFARHDSEQGACRRRGPSVISVTQEDEAGTSTVSMSVWPMIGEKDWCGEYELRRGHSG